MLLAIVCDNFPSTPSLVPRPLSPLCRVYIVLWLHFGRCWGCWVVERALVGVCVSGWGKER